jgi:predicted DNA-binding transcriptional regulator AlpA
MSRRNGDQKRTLAELPDLLTTADVMQVLQVSRTSVFNMCKAGDLQPVTFKGMRDPRFRKVDIEELLGLSNGKVAS